LACAHPPGPTGRRVLHSNCILPGFLSIFSVRMPPSRLLHTERAIKHNISDEFFVNRRALPSQVEMCPRVSQISRCMRALLLHSLSSGVYNISGCGLTAKSIKPSAACCLVGVRCTRSRTKCIQKIRPAN
jgi:hypothetical protein